MDRVKLASMLGDVLQGVGLVELERVARHRLVIHANHIEARKVIAHRRPTLSAEQVKQSHRRLAITSSRSLGRTSRYSMAQWSGGRVRCHANCSLERLPFADFSS